MVADALPRLDETRVAAGTKPDIGAWRAAYVLAERFGCEVAAPTGRPSVREAPGCGGERLTSAAESVLASSHRTGAPGPGNRGPDDRQPGP